MLNSDVLYSIIKYIDYADISNLCFTNKTFAEQCRQDKIRNMYLNKINKYSDMLFDRLLYLEMCESSIRVINLGSTKLNHSFYIGSQRCGTIYFIDEVCRTEEQFVLDTLNTFNSYNRASYIKRIIGNQLEIKSILKFLLSSGVI